VGFDRCRDPQCTDHLTAVVGLPCGSSIVGVDPACLKRMKQIIWNRGRLARCSRTMNGPELSGAFPKPRKEFEVGQMDQNQHSHLNLRSTPELQSGNERALVVCGLWLLIGFMGATAVAAGILQLCDGEANWLLALMLVVCGGILTATSTYRARVVLESAERPTGIAKYASPGAIHLLQDIPLRSSAPAPISSRRRPGNVRPTVPSASPARYSARGARTAR
jgi:hypothetical protein